MINNTAQSDIRRDRLSAFYAASVTEMRGDDRSFGEKTVYGNRWVRLGLVDVAAPTGSVHIEGY